MKRAYVVIVVLVVAAIGLGTWLYVSKHKNATANIDKKLLTPLQDVPPDSILKIDLNQDLSKLSIQNLRLLRSSLYARQGYCFMEADLRGYFTVNMKIYDSIMNERWYLEEHGPDEGKAVPKFSFTSQEQAFINKIDTLIALRQRNNYDTIDGRRMANVDNIVNMFQVIGYSTDFLGLLRKNNFAIVPDTNAQLFYTYEENDYHQLPNFITTDAYLQVFHIYFNYVLKLTEKRKFIPLLTKLTSSLCDQSIALASSATNQQVKDAAAFNAVFFAIPYAILSGQKKNIPAAYQNAYTQEIQNIMAEKDANSPFLQTDYAFPYSLYKPRGHYTSSDDLKHYFKAMMWLQTAYQCREKNEQLQNAVFMALLLNNGAHGELQQYKTIHEVIEFLIGESDNLSVLDVCGILKQKGINQPSQIFQGNTLTDISNALAAIAKTKNRIQPRIKLTCSDKINFMPQRYLADNEILQDMFDPTPKTERPYPKGLDVFAALGITTAEDILLNEEHDDNKWKNFTDSLASQKKKFADFGNAPGTVYNKWMQSLLTLQNTDKSYPCFMQTKQWSKKELNTALASWAELKHDAILYGEEPGGAECGGDAPPDPITVGFVEPNIAFWQKLIDLTDMTESLIKRNNLDDEELTGKTKSIKESFEFLKQISNKELNNIKITDQEYKQIEIAGSNIEQITLSVMDPDKQLPNWQYVEGPDKAVAVVADVFTRNIEGDNHNGILHEATGNANSIYVVIDVNGYLYIAKGAVFSYYEFVDPTNRLNDEEWQKRLQEHNAPPLPDWIQELVLPSEKIPIVDERISYSSGC